MISFPYLNFSFSLSQIPFYIMLVGAFIMAILFVVFFWSLAEYVFFRGDDAERAHAKHQLLNATAEIFLLMIIWTILSWLAGLIGIH